MQEIGERIKEIRKSNNLTKKEFGDMLSVAEKTIYNYETGKTPVTLEFLYKVSSVFHIDYDYLIHKPESISHVPYSQNIVPKSSHSDSLVSPSQDDLSINQKSNNLVKIPVFDEVYASAGHGLINEEH
ncbi:helix-turn-helix domain-containing protein, partial [Helicobacter trogontum]|uniref:helix-turn-helix domain-containing protein n=1 Tax=Helicobacter trogontum TaxID=50960 RepID=UPI0034E8A3C3